MAGIVFLKTKEFDRSVRFYRDEVGMKPWLEQPGICILRHGNLLLGFHAQPEADTQGMFTFFYRTRAEVDEMYRRLKGCATTEPKENQRYRIYHFFGKDPEGRNIECQAFLHDVEVPGDAW
jgi:catechol 2,3-dioxygenase-like lactoylglutathione lyase family enzyme